MRLLKGLAALLVCCSFHPACAEDNTAELDTIIVTASRSEQKLGESLAPVTLITRDDIERLQPQDVQDLLVGLPGVSIVNNGGPGKSTSIFLRGTESDHVLVLIDGIKIGSATSGGASLEQIPVDQIERIEIVRGPRSSLYGSEALGGVIQIFTRRGDGRGSVPSFSIGGGNLGSGRVEAGLRGGIGDGWYAVGLGARSTDGINARPSVNQPDKDGYRSLSGSLRGGWHFGSGAELSAHWLRADGDNEFDGSSENQSETTQQVLGTQLRLSPLQRWQLGLSAGQSRSESDNLFDGVFKSRFDTRRDYTSWQNDLQLAAGHQLILGVDHQRDRIDSTTVYAVDSRDNTGGFAQYQGRYGRHDAQLSFRHDDNQQFGGHDTGAVAWGYRFDRGIHLSAAYATAFKAPTFNELYFPNFGNPEVDPEEARNAELGLGGLSGRWNWNLSAFRTEIDQLITYDSATQTSYNIDEAVIRGAEAQLGTRLGNWRLQSYLSWLDPENRADGANHGKVLPRRSRQTGRIEIDRAFKKFSLGATLYGSGARYDNASNSNRLGGYSTLALRGDCALSPRWLLQAEASNVFDEDYETAATYAQLGTTLLLTLRYTPGG